MTNGIEMPEEISMMILRMRPRDIMARSPVAWMVKEHEFIGRRQRITEYWAFMGSAYGRRDAYEEMMKHPIRKFKYNPRYFVEYEIQKPRTIKKSNILL